MTHEIVVRLKLTGEEIASLDRMVASAADGTRTRFINNLLREVITDELADSRRPSDQAGEGRGAA